MLTNKVTIVLRFKICSHHGLQTTPGKTCLRMLVCGVHGGGDPAP